MEQGYNYRFALEPKPNEPRGDIYLATTGNMLALSKRWRIRKTWRQPEYAHDTMAGLNFVHQVAQAMDAGKLFHIDLNGQKPGRFDQDLRFGQEDQKTNFFLVKLLEDNGYDNPRHFDAHALRTSNADDVWEFAKGSMRTYLILKEKAQKFNADSEIQGIIKELNGDTQSLVGAYSEEGAEKLMAQEFDVAALTNRPLPYERLDQLVVELLLGVR
jgi:xylose isomerase